MVKLHAPVEGKNAGDEASSERAEFLVALGYASDGEATHKTETHVTADKDPMLAENREGPDEDPPTTDVRPAEYGPGSLAALREAQKAADEDVENVKARQEAAWPPPELQEPSQAAAVRAQEEADKQAEEVEQREAAPDEAGGAAEVQADDTVEDEKPRKRKKQSE